MIRFLKELWKALKPSAPDKKANTDAVLPDEKVARFIYQKSDWSKQPFPKPKVKVFLPEKFEGQWETSVCRISAISEQRILDIGNRVRQSRLALARAEFLASSVDAIGLRTTPAPDLKNNYSEHAVLVGWPDEKEKQMELSILLISSSELKLLT